MSDDEATIAELQDRIKELESEVERLKALNPDEFQLCKLAERGVHYRKLCPPLDETVEMDIVSACPYVDSKP